MNTFHAVDVIIVHGIETKWYQKGTKHVMYYWKGYFSGNQKNHVAKAKMLLSVVTALLCRGTLLQI